MKILAPLDSVDEVEELAQAGAEEFYCGLLEEKWHEQYPVISINRRPAGKGHFRTFNDLSEVVSRAHVSGAKVFFTLNEHYYVHAQYELLEHYIRKSVECGIDAFIISDLALMIYLRDRYPDVKIHASTGTAVFNRMSAMFFHDMGVERITLPRHLNLMELKDLLHGIPFIETTAFVLNSRCINVDGLCTFHHGLSGREIPPMYRNACMLPYDITPCSGDKTAGNAGCGNIQQDIAKQKMWEKVHVDDYPCGACALSELKQAGVKSVKIVGRGNPAVRKKKDVCFIKRLISMLESGVTGREFRDNAAGLYQDIYSRQCRGYMCYYPSVMKS